MLAKQSLKNIARPVRVYRVELGGEGATLPTAPASALPDKPSIAVLPFTNMSGDVEQDYFCDGLVEDIITTLSKLVGYRSSHAIPASFTRDIRLMSARRLSNLACDTF